MKKQLLLAGAAVAIVGSTCVFPVTSTSAQGTKFPANMGSLDNPFVITSVQPSTNKLKIRYNGELDNVQPLSLINIQAVNEKVGSTEERVDDMWAGTGSGKPYWTSIVYYEKASSASSDLGYGSEEQELVRSQSPIGIDLGTADLHLLYYSILPGTIVSSRYLTGKIDYTLCMKSAVYKPGVECRAVNKPQGGLWYWPYYNGEKLELPREEWDDWGYKGDEPQPKPDPQPEPTPTPQIVETSSTNTQVQRNTEVISRTVATAQNNTDNAQQTEPSVTPQVAKETVEVPVSGEPCPDNFPWWLVILWIISLGVEGVVLRWWFGYKRKN